MDDRRVSPRASCRLHGRVLKGTERVRCRIADVSESGLCLITPVWMKPKQEVEIEIDVPAVGVSKVVAEIWHVRREKSRNSNNRVWIAGVMVIEADPSYDRLLHAAGVATENELDADDDSGMARDPFSNLTAALNLDGQEGVAAASQPSADPVDAVEHRVFRIRCKARGGPRSRVLTLAAESVQQAEMLATRDLGDTWTVLEVREA